MESQIIKLKKSDLNKAVIRGLSHSAWQTKKTLAVKEQVHANPKFKKPKHLKIFIGED
ncbi:MAG: hypothetical protein WC249_01325 [Patescibacteria group bacterium]